MKNTVRILMVLLLAVLLCAALIACDHDDTEHVAAGDWQSDATHHWKGCEDECEGAQVDKAEHAFDNACDADCNVCGYARTPAAHAYDNACDTTCNVCGATRTVTHVYDKTVANSDYLKAAATASAKAQYWKSCACGAKSDTEYFETDKTAATVTNIQNLSKTYDNVELANPTYNTNSDGAATFEWYQGATKLDAKPVNAGTYKVKVIISETAAFAGVSAEKEFTIAKKAATFTTAPTMSAVTIKYSENYGVNYTTDGDGAVTIEYKVKDADDATYTTNVPANKGLYTARVSVAEGTNYKAVSATVDFEIEAYVLSGLSTNVVYNASNTHEIDLTTNGYSGVTLRVTFGNNGDVGANPTGVVVLENDAPTDNYLVDVGTCTVNIVAKTVSVTWTAPASLRFDGTEKAPTAALTGVLDDDDCTVQISRKDGDNVWFGETFTYEATMLDGADADNYALPLNGNGCTSPEYTITIDSVAVGAAADVGATSFYDGTYYYKVALEQGYYYFQFDAVTQGAEFTFGIYKKGESDAIEEAVVEWTSATEWTMHAGVFYIEEAGDYYVKSVSSDETEGDELTILADTHTEADSFGFCRKGCGTYLGEELTTNGWETVQLTASGTTYYRFADDPNNPSVHFNVAYNGAHSGVSVSCYASAANGEFALQTLTETAGQMQTPTDGYYYLVITATADIEMTFQIEQTTV